MDNFLSYIVKIRYIGSKRTPKKNLLRHHFILLLRLDSLFLAQVLESWVVPLVFGGQMPVDVQFLRLLRLLRLARMAPLPAGQMGSLWSGIGH